MLRLRREGGGTSITRCAEKSYCANSFKPRRIKADASALSPSEPVMSDGAEVWQPANPKASVAAATAPARCLAAETR